MGLLLRSACSVSYKSEIKLYRKLQKNILFIVLFVCLFLYSLTTLNSFIDLPVWQLIDFARSFLLSTQLDITHLDLLLSLNDLHYAQFVQFTWLNCTPFFRSYVEYLQKPYWKILVVFRYFLIKKTWIRKINRYYLVLTYLTSYILEF